MLCRDTAVASTCSWHHASFIKIVSISTFPLNDFRTLYVGMAQGVSFSLYIGMEAKFQNMQKTGKRRLRRAEYRTVFCKLTLKVSEHIPLGNNRASKFPVFFFFSSSFSPAVTQEVRGLLERLYYKTTRNFPSCILFRTGSQSDNIQHQAFMAQL